MQLPHHKVSRFGFYIVSITIIIILINLSELSYNARLMDKIAFLTFDVWLVFLFGFYFIKNKQSLMILLLSLIISSILMISVGFDQTGLIGPDEIRYYARLLTSMNMNWDDSIIRDVELILDGYIVFASSYPVFSLIVTPYYKIINSISPESIYFFNVLFYYITISFIYVTMKNGRNSIKIDFIYILALTSPYIKDLSIGFGKDIISICLSVLTVRLVLNKRWILSAVMLIIAMSLRPYSPLIIFIMWALITDRRKYLVLITIVTIIGTCIFTGFKSTIIKLIGTSFYFLFMPNPLLSSGFELGMYSVFIEFTILMILLVSIFYQANSYEALRKMSIDMACITLSSACMLIIVGFIAVNASSELSYSASSFTPGDNVYRKQLTFYLLLICFLFKYAIKRNYESN